MVTRRLSAQRVTRGSDGVEIAYAKHGAGAGEAPAVVLVHGWAGNRTYWDQAERNFVIAVDLGGHGASGLGRDEWNLAAFGDDVLAVVDVGAQRFALGGHSMGGDAIAHAARRLGDRVVGLVWVDVFRSLGDEPVSSPEQVEAFVRRFAPTSRPRLRGSSATCFLRARIASSSIESRPT
jgi:pimeloyl-ACP methyl ester carboxylesterase